MSFSPARMARLTTVFFGAVTLMSVLNLAAAVPGVSAQPEAKITGTITDRNGEAMNVKTANGKIVEVVLNSDTKIDEPEGVIGFRKKRLDVTALTAGLSVTIQGLQYENDQLVAKTITFSPHSLQSTNTTPSAAASGAEVANLADYDVKATYDAHFEAGSALLSQSDKTGLMNLASSATGLSSYVIQVRAFADVPGNNSYDQQLSRDRAEAVIDYLEQTGKVPVTHIVAPGVLGSSAPTATNEPAGGNPENRRAEVKLLVRK